MLPILLTLLALPAHQHRFFLQLISLWQAIPGRINARNFSRHSGWNERTLRRWFQKTLPWAQTGLELSCLALLSWSGHHAFPVHVQQTRPRRDKSDRLEQHRDQLVSLLQQHRAFLQRYLRVVVADGQYAKTMFMDAVSREGYALVTKLQSNANLLYPFTGTHPKRRGGRQK